jgi:excisionase family DNA binding protein
MSVTKKPERFSYSVAEVSDRTSLSKAFLRNEIKAGRLLARRCGRRVIVLHENLHKYLTANEKGDEK